MVKIYFTKLCCLQKVRKLHSGVDKLVVQKPTWYYRNLVYKSSDIYPWFTKVECFEFLRGFSCFLGCSQNSHTDTSAHLFLIEKNCTTKKICRVFFTYFYFARTYVQKSPNHSHNATFFSQRRSIFKILAMAWKKNARILVWSF